MAHLEKHAQPCAENNYLAAHVALLLSSLRHWTGRNLIDPALPAEDQARRLFEAPFALLSHNAAPDPLLRYANRTALRLFELSWQELITMPSRLTAEAPEQSERARLLAEVTAKGFIDNYAGIRVTKTGQRFRIERATVWNVLDDSGVLRGQAATFARWQPIS